MENNLYVYRKVAARFSICILSLIFRFLVNLELNLLDFLNIDKGFLNLVAALGIFSVVLKPNFDTCMWFRNNLIFSFVLKFLYIAYVKI